ncbi:hypothetical protein ACLB0R_07965 [Sphingomonas sp. GlSt437]|uniref:hypothetical protein n=1 Tax=Sphingomonas sp. GlSt437 TaxID=3389970 RepID=UPI003A8747C8
MKRVGLAQAIYRGAAIYGILVLLPVYFAERLAPADKPFTHPEMLYGFVGTALAMQLVYWTIGGDPIRYRALMPISVLAKLAFAVPCALLFAAGRLDTLPFALSQIDTLFAGLFFVLWRRQP